MAEPDLTPEQERDEALTEAMAANRALDMTVEENERLRAGLLDLAEWAANRRYHSGVSDLNVEEERGWNLALSGLEARCRKLLEGA